MSHTQAGVCTTDLALYRLVIVVSRITVNALRKKTSPPGIKVKAYYYRKSQVTCACALVTSPSRAPKHLLSAHA